ncbi:MAG TPA: ORC1-type DNA replication protein [Candidatus Altiarchaeales archaeon]|nr:ORC1-type DNA replication protein [Candidatus Altiarchaeales archaeon]
MRPEDMLLDEETLFRDESVFTPSYIPTDFMHRDSQIREIVLSLKPGIRGYNPLNLLLCGPPATGKTTALKYVFREVRENTSKLITVYVNCEDSSTPYSIFAKIYEKVYGISPPSTGKPLEDIKWRIFTKLKRDDRSIVIALDELDRLFLNNYIAEILVDLLKSHSTHGYDRVGIIGVMISQDMIVELNEKTRSVFNPSRVFFQGYREDEIFDILENRVKHGFYPDVISKELLRLVSRKTFEGGDLRMGIDLLRKSALIAEHDSLRRIEKKHIEQAMKSLAYGRREELIRKISDDARNLLSIIERNNKLASGEIYEKFRNETNIGIKKYNQFIKELEFAGLISSIYEKGRGRKRRFILKI